VHDKDDLPSLESNIELDLTNELWATMSEDGNEEDSFPGLTFKRIVVLEDDSLQEHLS
jgi:hypothetical protein